MFLLGDTCILNLDSYLMVSEFMFRAMVASPGCIVESPRGFKNI